MCYDTILNHARLHMRYQQTGTTKSCRRQGQRCVTTRYDHHARLHVRYQQTGTTKSCRRQGQRCVTTRYDHHARLHVRYQQTGTTKSCRRQGQRCVTTRYDHHARLHMRYQRTGTTKSRRRQGQRHDKITILLASIFVIERGQLGLHPLYKVDEGLSAQTLCVTVLVLMRHVHIDLTLDPGPALGGAGPNLEQFRSAQVPSQHPPRSVELVAGSNWEQWVQLA